MVGVNPRALLLLGLGLGLLLATASGRAAAPNAPAILPRMHKGYYVVLGKVLAVRVQDRGTKYTYRVRVLCAVPGGPRAGSSATIVGFRTLIGSWPSYIPIMRPGAHFVMAVSRRPDGSFSYGDWGGTVLGGYALALGWTPFGIYLPSPVAKADVAALRASLVKYDELYKTGKPISAALASKLRSSRNYYLWALGTWAMAKRAAHGDVLFHDLDRFDAPGLAAALPPISPRRAFWIFHCVCQVAPRTSRPPRRLVLDNMILYLFGKASQTREAGYKP